MGGLVFDRTYMTALTFPCASIYRYHSTLQENQNYAIRSGIIILAVISELTSENYD